MGKFGYETIGDTGSDNLEETMLGAVYTCPDDGIADSITIYLGVSDAAKNVKCALYTHDAVNVEPDDLVLNGVTEERLIGVTAGAWETFNFVGTKPILKADTYYWLVLFAGSAAGELVTKADAGTLCCWKTQAYNGFPANFGVPDGDSALDASIYCNYHIGHTETIAEILGLTDTIAKKAALKQAVTEKLGMTDAIGKVATYHITQTEILGLKDAAAPREDLKQAITEVLGLKDTVKKIASYHITLTDSLAMLDTIGVEHTPGAPPPLAPTKTTFTLTW